MSFDKNEKIILVPTSIDLKVMKIGGVILIFCMVFLLFVFNIGYEGNFIIKIIINIDTILLFILSVYIVLLKNKKLKLKMEL